MALNAGLDLREKTPKQMFGLQYSIILTVISGSQMIFYNKSPIETKQTIMKGRCRVKNYAYAYMCGQVYVVDGTRVHIHCVEARAGAIDDL